MKLIFGQEGEIVLTDSRKKQPEFKMTPSIAKKAEAMHRKLILSGKSKHTVSAYRSHTLRFFNFFENQDISKLSKEAKEEYLLQANVNLRFIQSCLGHESLETTQIYTHIVSINNNVVRSPLDRIIDKMKREEGSDKNKDTDEKEEKT